MDKCIEIGADDVVNHREADWSKKIREITKKQGVDVVFEHIGKATFPQEVALLKIGGTLVATGATTGYDTTLDLDIFSLKEQICWVNTGNQSSTRRSNLLDEQRQDKARN